MPFIYKNFDGLSALLVTGCKIYSWAQKNHSSFQETGYRSNKTILRATAIFLIARTTRSCQFHKKTPIKHWECLNKKNKAGRASFTTCRESSLLPAELHRPWGALLWCWLACPQPSRLWEVLYSWWINSPSVRREQHPVSHCFHSPLLLSRGRLLLSTRTALLTTAPCSQLKPQTSLQCL